MFNTLKYVIMKRFVNVTLISLAVAAFGCYGVRPSSGGAEANTTSRKINSSDIALPKGYEIKMIASGLTFPTGITFDENGQAYVIESGYAYGEKWTEPRLLKLDGAGNMISVGVNGTKQFVCHQAKNRTNSFSADAKKVFGRIV